MVEPTVVSIKGITDGLLVTLGEGDWPGIQNALINSLEQKSSFFQGAQLAMEVGSRELRLAELSQLRDQLSKRGISLWAVVSSNLDTEQTAKVLGLATKLSLPRVERGARKLETTHEGENGVFIRRTLRSGFKLSSGGHISVLGDVRPGAEVIARGSVIIWGRARGSIFAGAEGDDTSVVCAMRLEPRELRIANLTANITLMTAPSQPVCAVIRNGVIVIEPWKTQEH
ncbi:MAG TPA: septum site-determining protein MinC [Longilinea sp.]|nr:septum site-determining protein MinC [Longilinea sp.]